MRKVKRSARSCRHANMKRFLKNQRKKVIQKIDSDAWIQVISTACAIVVLILWNLSMLRIFNHI